MGKQTPPAAAQPVTALGQAMRQGGAEERPGLSEALERTTAAGKPMPSGPKAAATRDRLLKAIAFLQDQLTTDVRETVHLPLDRPRLLALSARIAQHEDAMAALRRVAGGFTG